MAGWSGSGWGQSERSYGFRTMAVSLLIVAVLGGVIGYVLRGSATPATNIEGKAFRESNVIVPSADAVPAAAKNSDGAVRAVTSFITGLPQVSISSPQKASAILDSVVDPRADPAVRAELQNTIDSGRNVLIGTGSFTRPLTTKLLFSPASYKVEMLAPDRARVQMWMVLVTVDGDQQKAIAAWSTSDVVVQWSDHWRISSFASSLGPTPTVSSENGVSSPYTDIANRINGFTGYNYALGTTATAAQ